MCAGGLRQEKLATQRWGWLPWSCMELVLTWRSVLFERRRLISAPAAPLAAVTSHTAYKARLPATRVISSTVERW